MTELENVIESRLGHLKSGRDSPFDCIDLLRGDILDETWLSRNFEYNFAYRKLIMLRELLRRYFDKMLRGHLVEKINEYKTLPLIKKMLTAEIMTLNASDFDDDIVLNYEGLKKRLTAIKSFGSIESDEIKKEYLAKYNEALFAIVIDAADGCKVELQEKLISILERCLKDTKGKSNEIKLFNQIMETIIVELHFTVFGWPSEAELR